MIKNETKNCVIWTRVSTKYQEDNGGSLHYQKDCCEKYANSEGFNIVNYFGGSHESAKTPGKFIKEMIKYLKKDRSIKYVIVSQIDRFSRNAGQGITMFTDLLDIDVVIIEATSGLSTKDHFSLFMLQTKLCMAQLDNSQRTDKFTRGRISCLQSGVYCGAVPIGYDYQGKSVNRTFSINEDGKLIKKAFQWKLQGLANNQIIEKLKPYGLRFSKQRLHKILTNPFYAGKIKHRMLNFEIIDGNQPPIISYQDFLKVQEILSGRTGVYKHKKETPQFPLKRHLYCHIDQTPMTAYTVKRKGIDYYKCNCVGCKTNVSAKKLHYKYAELLDGYDIPQPLVEVTRDIIIKKLGENQTQQIQTANVLKKQKSEKENKLKTCKIRYGMGEIDDEIYTMTIEALQSDIDKITLELSKYSKDLSNLENRVNDILIMCCHLGSTWKNADLLTAQKLQNLIFPKGIYWDKELDGYRTIEENEGLAVIRKITESYEKENEESLKKNSSSVPLCARRDSNPHVVRHQILSLARLPLRHVRLCDCKVT